MAILFPCVFLLWSVHYSSQNESHILRRQLEGLRGGTDFTQFYMHPFFKPIKSLIIVTSRELGADRTQSTGPEHILQILIETEDR